MHSNYLELFESSKIKVTASETTLDLHFVQQSAPKERTGSKCEVYSLFTAYKDLLCEAGSIWNAESASIPYECLYCSEIFELLEPAVHFFAQPYKDEIFIQSKGTLGYADFKYQIIFKSRGVAKIYERFGGFLNDSISNFYLEPEAYRTINTAQLFNQTPGEEKTKIHSLRTLGDIKQLGRLAGIYFDSLIRNENIIIASKIKPKVLQEENDRISLYPQIEGVHESALRDAFLQLGEPQSVYDILDGKGGAVRAVLDNDQMELIGDLQKVRHESGTRKDKILSDILGNFRDGHDIEKLDLSEFKTVFDLESYSPRVIGLTTEPLIAKVSRPKTGVEWFRSDDSIKGTGPTIEIESSNGNEIIEFEDKKDFLNFARQLKSSFLEGHDSVLLKDKLISINQTLVDQVESITPIAKSSGTHEAKLSNSKTPYLDIKDNEQELNFIDEVKEATPVYLESVIPSALKKGIELKNYQIAGLQWMLRCYNDQSRRGIILADDMGLGKTLQSLCFLAAIFQKPFLPRYASAGNGPALIVCPQILISNWYDEAGKFFNPDGLFPILQLHSGNISSYRNKKIEGHSAEIEAVLNLELMMENRIVITSYDTIKKYRLSFCKIPWSVVIADEAQAIKDINHASHTMKALKVDFKIVSTGTPVENSLQDLWNLMDFAEPGRVFGSLKDFSNRYVQNIKDITSDERAELAKELRSTIKFGTDQAYLVRREKKQLRSGELPKKLVSSIAVKMNDNEKKAYESVLAEAYKNTGQGKHFGYLHQLKAIADHPAIYAGDSETKDVKQLISESTKIRELIKILSEIKNKKEKVLIFALARDTQSILQRIIADYFGLNASIVNGESIASSNGALEYRRNKIKEFENKQGFNVIILSPMVAGVGLTITEANHVIHYSRWWNPAKEDQASDRAYRIGQKKDVTVYYLIHQAQDTSGNFTTFDENIDKLLTYKRTLASDFLMPIGDLNVSDSEIFNATIDPTKGIISREGPPIRSQLDLLNLHFNDFEALTALLLEEPGTKVHLNRRTGDRGIDVIAISKDEVILLQCKHSKSGSCIKDSMLVEQLLDGQNRFQGDWPQAFHGKRCKLIGVTNATFERAVVEAAKSNKIELIQGPDLIKRISKKDISLAKTKDREKHRLTDPSEAFYE
jgi:SNF2 family DNA or RNA helicase